MGTVNLVYTSEAISGSGLGNTTTTVVNAITLQPGGTYTGQGIWSNSAGGSWGAFSNWQAAGGYPGLAGSLSTNDTATFNTYALSSGSATVTLDGSNPALNGIIFSNSLASYTIGQGTGSGSITLVQGTVAPYIYDLAGSDTITAPIRLSVATTVSNAASSGITLGGPISGAFAMTFAGAGTTILTGSNSYTTTTINSNAVLQIGTNGTNGTYGSSGAITDNGTLIINLANTLSNSSIISGSGSFIQAGSGTTILSAANTFTGGTIVNGGTLTLVDLLNNGTGVIRGSLSVNSNATVLLTTNGVSALGWSTGLAITNLVVNGGSVIGSGRQLLFTAAANPSVTLTMSGGLMQQNGGVSSPSASNYFEFGNVSISVLSNPVTSVISGRVYVRADASPTLSFNVASGATNGTDLLVSAALTDTSPVVADQGAAGIVKTGAGVMVLSGTNTYRGPTTVGGGILRAGSTQAFGTNSGVTLSNVVGTQFDLNGYNNTVGSVQGGGTNGGNITLGTATLTAGGNNSNTVFAGNITGTGGITKVGTGTWTLVGSNGYSGTTLISAGTLQIGTNSAVGNLPPGPIIDNANLQINLAANLLISNGITGTGTLSQIGNGTTTLLGSNTLGALNVGTNSTLQIGTNGATDYLYQVSITDAGNLIFDLGRNFTNGASVSGAGTITQMGSGTMFITNAPSFTGTWAIASNSTMQVGNGANQTASLGTTTIVDNGFLNYSYTNPTGIITIANPISGSGSVTIAVAYGGPYTYTTYISLTGSNSFTGGLTLTGGYLFQVNSDAALGAPSNVVTMDGVMLVNPSGASTTLGSNRTISVTTNGGYFSIGNNATLTINSQITGSGFVGIGYQQGNVVFGGSNSYQGATLIGSGTTIQSGGLGGTENLKLANANALPYGTAIIFGPDGGSFVLDLNGYSPKVGGISSSANNATITTTTGDATLTDLLTNTYTYAGIIQNGSGTVSLIASGTGTQIFTGNNTYTGTTFISNGATIQIGTNGTTGNLGTGSVTVNGQLIYNLSNSLTVANLFTGSGSVTFSGNGNYTLTGTNNASNGTVIDSNAVVNVSSGTVFGSGKVVDNGGLVASNASVAFTLSNNITGSGSVSYTHLTLPTKRIV